MAFQFKAAPSGKPTWAAANRTEIIEVKIAVKPAQVELIDECLHDNTTRCLDLSYGLGYSCKMGSFQGCTKCRDIILKLNYG